MSEQRPEETVREALAFARRAAARCPELGWRADGLDPADAALDVLKDRIQVCTDALERSEAALASLASATGRKDAAKAARDARAALEAVRNEAPEEKPNA